MFLMKSRRPWHNFSRNQTSQVSIRNESCILCNGTKKTAVAESGSICSSGRVSMTPMFLSRLNQLCNRSSHICVSLCIVGLNGPNLNIQYNLHIFTLPFTCKYGSKDSGREKERKCTPQLSEQGGVVHQGIDSPGIFIRRAVFCVSLIR